ncbi:MAG: pyruvate kinase [Bacteroidota bacterium]
MKNRSMLNDFRRTKIVATLGPSSASYDQIEKLYHAGMNVARINFSHGSHDMHAQSIRDVRKVARKNNYSIPVLMDLQGPKIRVGSMKGGSQILAEGTMVTLTPEDVEGTTQIIPIDYNALPGDAEVGNRILIDDGLLELLVIEVNRETNEVKARVIVGGEIKSRKGVNLPGVKISMSSLTEKDLEDLRFGLEQDVDFVALSFVRSADDIRELKELILEAGSDAGVIAKIEKPEALEVIDEIIEESHGIMVARGDLGIEIASERVPEVQKRIIKQSRMGGKPVITATQMLDSMIVNPRPTRAESSDVANAVLDGTDAVMLSGETAAGKYPVEAIEAMDRICRTVEGNSEGIYYSLDYRKPELKEKLIIESIAYSCVTLGENVEAKAIITITHSGNTTRRISKFRPQPPIIAFTESQKVRRQLNLVWGVYSVKLDQIFDTDRSVKMMEKYVAEHGLVKSGDRVILATGIPLSKRGRTNMVKVSTID